MFEIWANISNLFTAGKGIHKVLSDMKTDKPGKFILLRIILAILVISAFVYLYIDRNKYKRQSEEKEQSLKDLEIKYCNDEVDKLNLKCQSLEVAKKQQNDSLQNQIATANIEHQNDLNELRDNLEGKTQQEVATAVKNAEDEFQTKIANINRVNSENIKKIQDSLNDYMDRLVIQIGKNKSLELAKEKIEKDFEVYVQNNPEYNPISKEYYDKGLEQEKLGDRKGPWLNRQSDKEKIDFYSLAIENIELARKYGFKVSQKVLDRIYSKRDHLDKDKEIHETK